MGISNVTFKSLYDAAGMYTGTLTNLTNEQYHDDTSDALQKTPKFNSVRFHFVALLIRDRGSSTIGLSVFQIASVVG